MSAGRVLNIQVPRAYVPFLQPRRYNGLEGGRGSAKSHFVAERLVRKTLVTHSRIACVREVQNSIKDSVKQLLEDKINKFGVRSKFKITEREIVGPNDSLFIFRGLQNHTATSIKSLEGFTDAWYEEAQSLSQKSIELATPTFRTGSKQWFSWNPDLPSDPVDVFFSTNKGDPDFLHRKLNYVDNPWFPDELRRDMERDRLRDPDKYAHIWLGEYRKNSEARVFRNWKIERFEPPSNTHFYFGADWGFVVDPTVLVCCYVVGRTLYVWREVWELGCGIDRRPALFDKIDPEWSMLRARDPNWKSLARRNVITADSAEAQTIDFMQRNGFPRMTPAVKGPHSVEEGVSFLQGYDIVVHPDCRHVSDELSHYSYKTDKKTGQITSELEDKDNHTIDALRYALESVRHAATSSSKELRL